MGSSKLEIVIKHEDIISPEAEAEKYEWLAETIFSPI
jgi:hypothetical protein